MVPLLKEMLVNHDMSRGQESQVLTPHPNPLANEIRCKRIDGRRTRETRGADCLDCSFPQGSGCFLVGLQWKGSSNNLLGT